MIIKTLIPAVLLATALHIPDAHSAASGADVYQKLCSLCHATGAGGAPMAGSKPDWVDRTKQGQATLHQHAIKGFQGKKGLMPAKGGNPALSDDDVKAAVDFMVSKVK